MTGPDADCVHIKKLCQIFSISKVGLFAVKQAEIACKRGVADKKANTFFNNVVDDYEDGPVKLLCADPQDWVSHGNAGGPQTIATFSQLVQNSISMVVRVVFFTIRLCLAR